MPLVEFDPGSFVGGELNPFSMGARYYRDGEPDTLRDTQSASKSALSALLGTAMAQGHITSVDQRVVDLVPEWAPLNADPRAATITLRHLLTLTAGFSLASGPRTLTSRPGPSRPNGASC